MFTRAVLLWLATRLPRLLQALAVVSFVAAIAAGYVDAQRNAARMLALRNPEPQPVSIQDFVPRQHQGLSGEASLVAQVDVKNAIRIRYREGFHQARAIVFPLVSTLADRANGTQPELLGYLYFSGANVAVERMSVERFLPRPLSAGPIGPIVALDGQPGAPVGLRRKIEGAYSDFRTRGFAAPVAITPFPEGRVAALSQPVRSHARLLLAGLGIVLLLVGSWLHHFLSRRLETRSMHAIALGGTGHSVPETDRARSRFTPLAEQDDLSGRTRNGDRVQASLRNLLRRRRTH